VIDPAAREAYRGGEPVDLTRTEFDLLDVLSTHPRVAFTRQRLLGSVWGQDWFGVDHVVDVDLVPVVVAVLIVRQGGVAELS